MVMRVAWEHDHKVHSANAGLAMNYSTDAIQEVTELNLEIHGGAGARVPRHAEKLVRDAFIWSHLAGDTVQRLKVAARPTFLRRRLELGEPACGDGRPHAGHESLVIGQVDRG